MTLSELKQGEFFTLKPIENPKDSQVYIKGSYQRGKNAFDCTKFSDVCDTRLIKSDKEIYIDFVF